ncbi:MULTISPECIES: hypothetical protein [unclassified Paenibacillus]|uniref:hypothetical protein n=1 Tax=unclassified Paenibacillus TaxID=185978 RepID=UPI0006D089AD|nr:MULTISPECIES: hypothetical protein [unclassified Paenibacillus]
MTITHWQGQDTLNLDEKEWLVLLKDKDIFDEIGLSMVSFVYDQPDFQSNATEIGEALGGVSQQQVTAWNRGISKKIYKKLRKEPPFNSKGKGGKRWWNGLFDGDSERVFNERGKFIWKLRPSLISALSQLRNHEEENL